MNSLSARATLKALLGNPFGDLDGWLACVDTYFWDFLLVPDERLFETWRSCARMSGRCQNKALAADREVMTWISPVG